MIYRRPFWRGYDCSVGLSSFLGMKRSDDTPTQSNLMLIIITVSSRVRGKNAARRFLFLDPASDIVSVDMNTKNKHQYLYQRTRSTCH